MIRSMLGPISGEPQQSPFETLPMGGSNSNRTESRISLSFRTAKASMAMEKLGVGISIPARWGSSLGIFLLTLFILSSVPSLLPAHEGATGVVKERMEAMKAIGAATKRIAAMMRGQQDYDAATVAEAAGTIGAHGGDAMTALFPKGSMHEPSQARPVIWEDWDRFRALARDLVLYSDALADAAGNEQGMMGNDRRYEESMGLGGPKMSQNPDAGLGPVEQLGEARPRSSGPMMPAEAVKQMPPQMAFMQLTRVCAACHEDFRIKK